MEEHTPIHAQEWYDGLIEAVYSLEEMPRRCGLAPDGLGYEREIRHLLYKKRSTTHRIVFAIMQEATDDEDGIVRIFRIRHGAQKPLTLPELRWAERD